MARNGDFKRGQRAIRRIARPLLRLVNASTYSRCFYEVLEAQIKLSPRCASQSGSGYRRRISRRDEAAMKLPAGQHAATSLPKTSDWGCYDLAISSFPPTVEFLRRRRIAAALSRLGSRAPGLIESPGRRPENRCEFCRQFSQSPPKQNGAAGISRPPLSAIENLGSGSRVAGSRFAYSRMLSGAGLGTAHVPGAGVLEDRHQSSRRRGAVGNNLRLFEATGTGALLLTDWKENLSEMFEPGKEVIAYKSPEECLELLTYYLEHDEDRAAIASAGQKRTLKEHTYLQRMEEFVAIVEKYL